ncbi:hypothetical protein H2203_002274 [Taxawa tesnikishii (nom. ined.)]|nr:hypothetical protein H2203_002274 [Dothideales sp. JES 119]
MAGATRPRVFLDITHGTEPIGRLIIELFSDKAPKTCENFRALCNGSHNGLSYATSPFHRIIDEFMVQGGDITAGDGTGGTSVYGGEFEDENLGWRDVDAAGLVCMANRGKGTNGSQFFITLESSPHLNNKHTIFGRLVSGDETLARMAKVDVDREDRPLTPVLIARCGELERKKKPATAVESKATEKPTDRGRNGRRHTSSPSRSPSRTAPPRVKNRRQSDNDVDETFRGRPRKRSESGSRLPTRSPSRDGGPSRSPARQHKRKRSPSPSRGSADGRNISEDRRRRRSLPNQYRDDRDGKRRDTDAERRNDRVGRERMDDDVRRQARSNRRDDMYARRRERGDVREGRYGERRNDSYRPARNSGRLGGGSYSSGGGDSGVKFKGRGSMKFREPDRRW